MSLGSLSAERRLPALNLPRAKELVSAPAALAVAGLTAVAALVRFWGLGRQGYWFDEGNTVLLVRAGAGRMLGLIPQTESTPPLYYCLGWLWARVFGFGEAGLRSLSALAGAATVPVAFAAGRELVSRRAGLVLAALAACNPLLIWYSQEARSYALLVLLCALGLSGFAAVLRRGTGRALALWALASGLALATHYYAVVAVAPQAVWLLVVGWRRGPVRLAVGLVGLVGMALIPLALAQNDTRRDSWIGHAPLGLRLRQIVPQALIGPEAPSRTLLKLLAFVFVAGAVALLVAGRRERVRVPALLTAAGVALALLFVAAGSDSLITRNLLPLWLPAAAVVAAGCVARRGRVARWLGAALAAGLCAVGLVAAVGVARDWPLQRPDWRLVARVLGPRPTAGSPRLILIQHYRTLLPLSLYLPHLRFVRHEAVLGVRELDVVAVRGVGGGGFCWWGSACNLVPSGVQSRYAVPGFSEVWRRSVRQFTVVRLRAATPQRVTPAEVDRALHTTHLRRDELLVQR